jgi:hypothetical protein
MVDCVCNVDDEFTPAVSNNNRHEANTLGIEGIWLVGSSRDYITRIETDELVGLNVYNSCGDFTVAIKK